MLRFRADHQFLESIGLVMGHVLGQGVLKEGPGGSVATNDLQRDALRSRSGRMTNLPLVVPLLIFLLLPLIIVRLDDEFDYFAQLENTSINCSTATTIVYARLKEVSHEYLTN